MEVSAWEVTQRVMERNPDRKMQKDWNLEFGFIMVFFVQLLSGVEEMKKMVR